MLQFQQIRCFVTLAGELHFGRAAERLNMTQPPFSRQIRLLEEAVGGALFDRDPRGVRLTALGRRFLPEAQHLVRCSDNAIQAARKAFKGMSGRVVVGYVMGISFGFLPEVVAAAAQRLPGVTLELEEMSSHQQQEALRAGRIDIALVRYATPGADLGASCVLRERFWLAMPVDHPLAALERVTVRDLHGQPLFMYQPGRSDRFHAALDGHFLRSGVSPRYVQYVRHGHAMLPLVDEGLGLALVPSSLRRMRYGHVAWRPIDLPNEVAAEAFMAWRERDERDNPVVSEMRQVVLEAAAAHALNEAALPLAAAPG